MDSLNIFLDDHRVPSDVHWVRMPDVEWTIVRCYDDFVKLVDSGANIALLSAEHDLDQHPNQTTSFHPYTYFDGDLTKTVRFGPVPTGWDCIRYLADNRLALPKIRLHSDNPVGVRRMVELLTELSP